MNLKHLNTFLVLSKVRHFTKTAEYLHYAQSNVTAQIKQLEADLDVRLFERIGKNVALTSEGEKLIPYAQKMLALSSEIKNLYMNVTTQRIVIGVSESLSIYKLPKILKAYKKKYPDVEIFLKTLETTNITALLTDNTIDIAFILDNPIHSNSTTCAFIQDEPISILAATGHLLTNKSDVTEYDFVNMPIILTKSECCYRKAFEKTLAPNMILPKIILESGNIQVIKETTLAGLGICVLPEFTVQKELDNQTIKRICYALDYDIATQLIYHKDKWLSPHLLDFIATVYECYTLETTL